MAQPTLSELNLCEMAGCDGSHAYPLADRFDSNPARCPRCGGSDPYQTDCWGHPFGYYTCRTCGDYSPGFEYDGDVTYDGNHELLVAQQADLRMDHDCPGCGHSLTEHDEDIGCVADCGDPTDVCPCVLGPTEIAEHFSTARIAARRHERAMRLWQERHAADTQ